jgi:hypothetical protein
MSSIKNNDKLVQLRHKHQIHQIHEISRGIGKAKRHNQILIESISGREGRLWYVRWLDFYLMVTRTKINLGENPGSG